MIEKPLFIIIFMYLAGFGLVASQYWFADVMGMTLTGYGGVEIRNSAIDILNMANLNAATANIQNATDAENSTLSSIDNAFQIGYNVAKILIGNPLDIATLLTGTYIFNFIYLMGGPATLIIIVPIAAVYAIMLGRTLIAYVRGV